jgi:hypothetical protein
MEFSSEPGQLQSEREAKQQLEPPAPAVDPRLAVTSGLGNQAFAQVVRATLARNPGAGTATAAPATGWIYEGYVATTAYQSNSFLQQIRVEAYELNQAGHTQFQLLMEEADSWNAALGSSPSRQLTPDEVRQLTEFGREYRQAYEPTVRRISEALVKQLSAYAAAKPIDEKALFDLRESIHHQFVRGAESDVISKTSELLGKTEDLLGEVKKWTGHAAEAKDLIAQAKKLEDIDKAVANIKGKVGQAKKVTDLAKSIAKMTGAIGNTPAGGDDIGALEAGLDVIDFAVSKVEIPGFKQLWEGYIFKAAKICVQQLRALKEIIYKGDREGGIAFFFEEHRNDPKAPDIKKAFFHGIDEGQHFPGGQAMFDFMWKLMREPDSVTKVPDGIEDFFVKWREGMNAGVSYELESDDSAGNLWNVFSRERAPNIVVWLRLNRQAAWIKLYGGMPAPG